VFAPSSGATFTALRGQGSWLDGRPIAVSTVTDVSQALVGTGFAYRADVRVHQGAELAQLVPLVRDIRRLGSAALDLCFVAAGRLDAYVERGLRPWDLAAAQLVVEEAGGRVEGMAGEPAGELITVAAPAVLFDAFRGCLDECGYGAWPMPDWPPARPS
jgi:myo-inositol-1(or 4)-monophosphatase